MQNWQDLWTTSQEGLKLYARRYGPQIASGLPVVCLPGLSRNSSDFQELATYLTREGTRQVYAFDSRGRGRSDNDPNWKNYDIRVELADLLVFLTSFQIAEAVFVGTSRGGMLTMALTMLRPTAIRGAVLNDIGPVIEGKGLARIKSYVGKLPQPRTFAEAGAILKRITAGQFTALSDADWEDQARRSWREKGGRLVLQYDPNLMKTLEVIDLEQPLPTLWPQFEALAHAPVLSIRGANSDLFSAETAAEMAKRHPNCALHLVPDEGHAPLLADAPTLQRIEAHVKSCET